MLPRRAYLSRCKVDFKISTANPRWKRPIHSPEVAQSLLRSPATSKDYYLGYSTKVPTLRRFIAFTLALNQEVRAIHSQSTRNPSLEH